MVGNNLANLNTPGFKTSQVCFRDLVTQSLGAGLGETQVGFGTGQPLTVRQFTQGAIQTSSGLLDAAIQGDGFFVLKDDAGNTLYTRAGNFQADKNGNLLTDTGERVQGWTTIDPHHRRGEHQRPDREHHRAGGCVEAADPDHQFHARSQPELVGRGGRDLGVFDADHGL